MPVTDMTADDVELTIDPEFRALLPAHSADEDREFRAAIEADGAFTDPILYWTCGPKKIVVDGHRRYDFWTGLPEGTKVPPPLVKEVFAPDREAAKRWMLRHQLGRRNLDPKAASLIRGRLYNREKADAPSNLKHGENPQKSPKGHNVPSGDHATARKVAEETGVNERTVRRDGDYAAALDAIGQVNGKAKHDIEAGTLNLPKKTVVAIGSLPEKEQKAQALKNLRLGKSWDEGLPESSNGKARKPKRKKPKEISPAKMVDALLSKHVSPTVKGLDAIAKAIGGKGKNHEKASAALDRLIEALKAMREGKQ